MAIHVQGYVRFKLRTEDVKALVERLQEDIHFLYQYTVSTGHGKEMAFEVPITTFEDVILKLCGLLLKFTEAKK